MGWRRGPLSRGGAQAAQAAQAGGRKPFSAAIRALAMLLALFAPPIPSLPLPMKRSLRAFIIGVPGCGLIRTFYPKGNMILEIARIEIDPSRSSDFENAVREALPLFARARGCGGAELHRVIERDGEYQLVVRWETVDDHMVHFRESEDFQAWRQLAGPFFLKAPDVFHTAVAVK
jgi:heme-degrading monooxygenase HmoA